MIEQTGTHRRIVFGEVFGQLAAVDAARADRIHEALAGADIQSEAVGDGRVPIWEKFIFLVSLAGFTGARGCRSARCGPTRTSARSSSTAAARSSASRAPKACQVAPDVIDRIDDVRRRHSRDDAVVAADRSGAGEADRGGGAAGIGRAPRRRAGVPVPIMSTLYAVLKPFAAGAPPPA